LGRNALAFYSGVLHGSQSRPIKSLVGYAVARSGLLPSIGHWHSIDAIRQIAAKHGLDTKLYGSLNYPYRFHVRMVPHGG
jgi:hypothetical protein